jgi:hypothetical protein
MRRLAGLFLLGFPCLASAQPDADARMHIAAATAYYALVLRGAPADSVAMAYSADGELVLPGMAPVHGREAIRAFLAPMIGVEQ